MYFRTKTRKTETKRVCCTGRVRFVFIFSAAQTPVFRRRRTDDRSKWSRRHRTISVVRYWCWLIPFVRLAKPLFTIVFFSYSNCVIAISCTLLSIIGRSPRNVYGKIEKDRMSDYVSSAKRRRENDWVFKVEKQRSGFNVLGLAAVRVVGVKIIVNKLDFFSIQLKRWKNKPLKFNLDFWNKRNVKIQTRPFQNIESFRRCSART